MRLEETLNRVARRIGDFLREKQKGFPQKQGNKKILVLKISCIKSAGSKS